MLSKKKNWLSIDFRLKNLLFTLSNLHKTYTMPAAKVCKKKLRSSPKPYHKLNHFYETPKTLFPENSSPQSLVKSVILKKKENFTHPLKSSGLGILSPDVRVEDYERALAVSDCLTIAYPVNVELNQWKLKYSFQKK